MQAYGANVRVVVGSREDTAAAAIAAAADDSGAFYASHVHQPAFLEGTKTFAFEVWEQLGRRAPDEMVVPVGNGTLLLGVHAGFGQLQHAGLIASSPRLIAVQAAACNPLVRAWRAGAQDALPTINHGTAAEGIAIAAPARSRQILAAVTSTGGDFVDVDEDEIAAAAWDLARLGLYLEPTAAATYAGLRAHLAGEPGVRQIVWPACGAGLKAP
jgi:threonine synthase